MLGPATRAHPAAHGWYRDGRSRRRDGDHRRAGGGGNRSHYNMDTAAHAALWSVMGVTIVVLWLATLAVALRFLREPGRDRVATTAIRLGLVVALIGLAEGFLMAHGGHTTRSGCRTADRASPCSAGAPSAATCASRTSSACTPCRASRCSPPRSPSDSARRGHPRPARTDRRGGVDRPGRAADLAGTAGAAAARPGRTDAGRARPRWSRSPWPRRSARSPRPADHRPDDRVRSDGPATALRAAPSRSPRRSGR